MPECVEFALRRCGLRHSLTLKPELLKSVEVTFLQHDRQSTQSSSASADRFNSQKIERLPARDWDLPAAEKMAMWWDLVETT